VTGRLASVTLPTGGTINYAYTGPNNSINCVDGTTAGLTKTTTDGTWTYTRNTSTWLQTTVTSPPPDSNQTVYTFVQRTSAPKNFYEIDRKIYQGSSPLLQEVATYYNGSQTVPSLPITSTDVYTTLAPMSQSSRVTTTYDNYGNVTDVKQYDFGASTPTLDTQTAIGTYGGQNTCWAIGSGINDRPCYTNAYDGAGNLLASEAFGWNGDGTLYAHRVATAVSNATWFVSYLQANATYNSNGTIQQYTDVKLAVTNYAYNGTGGCNNGLVTSITRVMYPDPDQTTSYQWNCNIGKMTQTTDPNSQSIRNMTYDSLLRPTSMTDPTGVVFNRSYNDSGSWWDSGWFTRFGTNSDTTFLTWFDGYGRPSQVGHAHDSAWSGWDYVPMYRDSTGRISQVYQPCTTSGGTCPPATGAYTTQTYDALNRPLLTTDGGGGIGKKTYSGRDVLTEIDPAPAGEVVKQTRYEYDGLGRLKSVCQISSASGSGSCGQDFVSGWPTTGFVTRYSYYPTGKVHQIVKNAQSSTQQSRTFTYDAIGRVLTETYPEQNNAATTYVYDYVTGYCANLYVGGDGDLLQKTDPNGNITCYNYDRLHRLLDVYTNGQSCKIFRYDSTGGLPPSGYTANNLVGRRVEAETDNCSGGMNTDEWFSYSARGELTDAWESTPHSGGYYHTTAAYWANGVLSSLSGVPGQSAWTYGVDGEGRQYTATQGSTSLVTNTQFNAASQPTVVSLGLGDSANYGYYPTTGLMRNYTFTVGSPAKSMTGTLNWNANGTLRQLVISDGFNSGGTQTCKYGDPNASPPVIGYDELGRLSKVDCGASVWQQNFSYGNDAFDNLTKTVPPGGTGVNWIPGYNPANNHYTLGGTSYDANGNLLNDTFHAYTWNADNHPITIDSTTLTYDALGRMIEKYVSGTYTEILYSPIGKTAQMNGQTLIQAYIPLPGGQTLFETPSVQNFWFSDWLGTVRLASDRAGRNVTCSTCFDRAFAPYGEMYLNFGSTANQNFTGDTQDENAGVNGLFDTPNRELMAKQGRWISPDPAHAGWNHYAYSTNPIVSTDPSGLSGQYSPLNLPWTSGPPPNIIVNGVPDSGWMVPQISEFGALMMLSGYSISNGDDPNAGEPPTEEMELPDPNGFRDVNAADTGHTIQTGNGWSQGSSQAALFAAGFPPSMGGMNSAAYFLSAIFDPQHGGPQTNAQLGVFLGSMMLAGTVRNVGGGEITAADAMSQAETWLGPGYKEIAPGVYRSADGLRQFRMTDSDLLDLIQGPHVHFESIGPDGRVIVENSHVGITDP